MKKFLSLLLVGALLISCIMMLSACESPGYVTEMEKLEIVLISSIIATAFSFLACIFLALIPAKIAQNKGYSGRLWWLYGLFLFWIALIHSLCLPSRYAKPVTRPAPVKTTVAKPSAGDEKVKKLKQYKELLDSGVITQEEFDAKKKELIDL